MIKRITAFTLVLVLCIGFAALPASALSRQELVNQIDICQRNKDVAHEMAECARFLGYSEDHFIIQDAKRIWAEQQALRKDYKAQLAEMDRPKYSENDLDLLSRLIWRECGCSWIPDWVQQYTASVVVNRMNCPYYPDTIQGVIYDPGQYGPAISGSINSAVPDERTIANCRYILENGSIIPSTVTGQNGDAEGGSIYASYYDSILDTTIYFTYAKYGW